MILLSQPFISLLLTFAYAENTESNESLALSNNVDLTLNLGPLIPTVQLDQKDQEYDAYRMYLKTQNLQHFEDFIVLETDERKELDNEPYKPCVVATTVKRGRELFLDDSYN